MKKSIVLLTGFILLVSCATGKCREQEKKSEGEAAPAAGATTLPGADIAATQPDAKSNKAAATLKVY
ncbi:MAG: hypothetical protein ABL958_08285, partial [Bdellovibrionia bacterium]